MKQINRINNLGLINRSKLIEFYFNDKKLYAFEGDTLASALLANGFIFTSRSIKYHRPRGLFAHDISEPNSIMQVSIEDKEFINVQATDIYLYNNMVIKSINHWPSLDFDIFSLKRIFSKFFLPGFIYKTFMYPRLLWDFYEKLIRKTKGFGKLKLEEDLLRYEKKHSNTDILIIGTGPSAISFAYSVLKFGYKIIMVEQDSIFSPTMLDIENSFTDDKQKNEFSQIKDYVLKHSNTTILLNTKLSSFNDHNFSTLIQNSSVINLSESNYSPDQILWKIRSTKVVIAAGAIERPMLFENNDLPGIMSSKSISMYLNRYGVIPGKNIVLYTNNDYSYQMIFDLLKNGISVSAVIDVRKNINDEILVKLQKNNIKVILHHEVIKAYGNKFINKIDISSIDKKEKTTIKCSVLAVSNGYTPINQYHVQSGGLLSYKEEIDSFVPIETKFSPIHIGGSAGIFDLAESIKSAYLKSLTLIDKKMADLKKTSELNNFKNTNNYSISKYLPSVIYNMNTKNIFVDYQTDTSLFDIKYAIKEGFIFVDQLRRYTLFGTGIEQGKHSNDNILFLLADILDLKPDQIGHVKSRPPFSSINFGAISGRSNNEFFDPIRITPIHNWHKQNNAIFENVGQWKRPLYYQKFNESMEESVNRECLAVRNSVGVIDASTLGKIEVVGPDSIEFLNMIYPNKFTNMKIAKCKYSLMLNDEGMIFDDGVIAKLDENHYLIHTTSSGASTVLDWLDQWLQTEWDHFNVSLRSVTDKWTTISVNGPKSRDLASRLFENVDFSNESFPFMSYKETSVDDIPIRIFRVSFSGELCFEINVPSNYGQYFWDKTFELGRDLSIVPYGTEAMHVLRAEKGFIIVGQDTDGSVTPIDIGAIKMLSKSKDFLGKRSLDRPYFHENGRKQLVGILPDDFKNRIYDGAHIKNINDEILTGDILGHITSSYFSPILNKSIALALVKNGNAMIGQKVLIIDMNLNKNYGTITKPVFYDEKGVKQQ
ncbi:MAG: sarcosine oxidase subunit alpha [Chloroflexi bacterium]|nr:sarcosine oxidase subunit alpha [Chloroflexota bacterium]